MIFEESWELGEPLSYTESLIRFYYRHTYYTHVRILPKTVHKTKLGEATDFRYAYIPICLNECFITTW
jgi:hypothetical protein